MLQIIGAGMPRTGTRTLWAALREMGLEAIHHSPARFNLDRPHFRVYDDVDAVCDAPACYWWRELAQAYPEAKVILTVRDEDTWWASMLRHAQQLHQRQDDPRVRYTHRIHTLLFGTPWPNEAIWRKQYREHNAMCHLTCPAPLMIVDWSRLSPVEAWESLGEFVGREPPSRPFPWLHRSCPVGAKHEHPFSEILS